MNPTAIELVSESLRNYRQLVARVDALCGRIVTEFGEHLACRRGCDACCRHLTLFPVEAAALALALRGLPEGPAAHIRARADASSPDGPCPLLEKGLCLMYEARPLICRTHGLPLLTCVEGEARVDFCPENFQGVNALPAGAVVNLEVLNTTLASIDRLFAAEALGDETLSPERLTIAEALLLDLG